MTDMATNPYVHSRKPLQSINHRILSILQVPFVIPQAVRATLNSAAEAFVAKSYKTAAKHLQDALDSMSNKDEANEAETVVLTKYMLCMCWLESTDAKDLMDALRILEELEKNYGYAYPMLYYAIGKAYFKLYRFAKANETLKKGFSILNGNKDVVQYKIPGTDVPIPESFRDRLVPALVSLNDQCSSWHRPDAVCCMPDCSNHNQNESADKNIFFESPTFIGMVQVSCNNTSNTCTISFHTACWKAKKETLGSLKKLSDKDLLHLECFTPNCNDQGERCTIKKIEIFDQNAKVKSSMTCADEVVRHTKVQPQLPKGAVRKQQQQQQTPKVKAANESRTPAERHPQPQHIPHEIHKTGETEDDDDLHDEQAIRSGVEKLVGLRASNFGIEDDEIWRPNLSLYGNEFMLATADALPDPDFSADGPEEAELKAFFFSYFYTFISKCGPVKLNVLTEKWDEAKHMIGKNCDSIFNHYIDIAEFLLQSVKFAVIGGYICVAEKLPETYDLAKSDACDTLRFFVENDIDQRSDSSSIDDEAFFNDIVNQEKNNLLPHSSISGDSNTGTDDLNVAFDGFAGTDKKMGEPIVDGMSISKAGQPLQYATSYRENNKNTVAVNDHTMGFVSAAAKPATPQEDVEKIKHIDENEPEFPVEKVSTPIKESPQIRAHSVENVNGEVSKCREKKVSITTKDNYKNDDSLVKAANSVDHVHEVACQRNVASEPKVSAEKLTEEFKSVNDIVTQRASSTEDHGALMCNSGESDERPNSNIPPSPTNENGLRSSENPLEAKNEDKESLVEALLEEVQRLSCKLSVSEDRTAELESEIAQMKKAHAEEKVKLLTKNLQGQHSYNYQMIVGRLGEWRKDFEIISFIKGMLMNSTGRTLPINITEQQSQTVIAEVEKILKKQKTRVCELIDKLKRAMDLEKITEIDLPLDPMPNMPAIDLMAGIQIAFSSYEGYVTNEIQRSKMFPQNPMIHYPHMFGGPRFPQQFAYSDPGIPYQPNCIPNRPPPPRPLNVRIPSPLYTPPPMQVIPLRPSAVPSTVQQKVSNPSESQTPPVPLQQIDTFAFGSTTSSGPSPSGSGSPAYWTPDTSKVAQQSPNIFHTENASVNPAQQQGSQFFSELGSAGNVQASEKSNARAPVERNDTTNDNSTAKSTASPVSSACVDNSQNLSDMPAALNSLSQYRQAEPKQAKPRKKNYHSMDKLVQALRSRHVGVLELDLVKSVETVRKNHRNSLTGIPMGEIIREAERIVMKRQQSQLYDYEKRPSSFSTVTSSSSSYLANGERKRENSISSTSSVHSAKKEPHGQTPSKKQWEPVVVPNDKWQKETPESECPICLQSMLCIAQSYTLQCKHTFHKECIKEWHEQNNSCPTCRVHSTIDDDYPPLPLC